MVKQKTFGARIAISSRGGAFVIKLGVLSKSYRPCLFKAFFLVKLVMLLAVPAYAERKDLYLEKPEHADIRLFQTPMAVCAGRTAAPREWKPKKTAFITRTNNWESNRHANELRRTQWEHPKMSTSWAYTLMTAVAKNWPSVKGIRFGDVRGVIIFAAGSWNPQSHKRQCLAWPDEYVQSLLLVVIGELNLLIEKRVSSLIKDGKTVSPEDNMIHIKLQYDAYNRSFKLIEEGSGSLLQDFAMYDLAVPCTVEEFPDEDGCRLIQLPIAHAWSARDKRWIIKLAIKRVAWTLLDQVATGSLLLEQLLCTPSPLSHQKNTRVLVSSVEDVSRSPDDYRYCVEGLQVQ
jgi:hypothetical protein